MGERESTYYVSPSYFFEKEIFARFGRNKKPMIKTLTATLKRILSPAMQSQYKASFRDGELELTQTGKNELMEILAAKYEAELSARAEEVIAENKCNE